MRFVSYLIVVIVTLMIWTSSRNSLDLISQKEIASFKDYLPKVEIHILEPIVDIIIKDFTS